MNTRQTDKKPRTLNVSLQTMEAFCEVIARQSFSRAGEALGISQSAVSQLIAHLESDLEADLIDRQRRPLKPTADGRLYYEGCQEILQVHGGLLDGIGRGRRQAAGTARVAAIYSAGLHTLGEYIHAFMTDRPGARVNLEYMHPDRVYLAVMNDETDLGVVSYPRSNRQLVVVPWLNEEMVLACPSHHRLAGRTEVRLADLEREKFVAFDAGLRIRQEIDRILRTHRVHIDIISEFDNIETIKQALGISGAVSILPRPTIKRELELQTLSESSLVDVRLTRPVGIIHRRKPRLTPTAEQFMQSLLASRGQNRSDAADA